MQTIGMLNKNMLRKYTTIGDNQLQKNVATLNSPAHIKQKRCVTCRAG